MPHAQRYIPKTVAPLKNGAQFSLRLTAAPAQRYIPKTVAPDLVRGPIIVACHKRPREAPHSIPSPRAGEG
jgi:hypothetical protein